jgi:predicted ATP-grasp superfamily ATP-dependent carboligase
MSARGRVLIVDEGRTWSTLCAARSLARAGWTVSVGSPGARGLTASSRSVSSRHDVPSLKAGLSGFTDAVRRAVKDSGAEVVFGGGDAEVHALSLEHDNLGAIVPYPDEPTVLRAFDKLELTQAAEHCGLEAPRTTEAPDDIDTDGPVLVKASQHWDPRAENGATRLEAAVVPGRAAIAARVAEIRRQGGAPLLQEVLDGDNLSLVLLRGQDGRTLGTLYQQIDHRWPVPAGWTARAHTLPVDADLARGAERLLDELGWFGLVELEFIRGRDGGPRLIDFNGRYYGSMQLAVAAGVDFPRLWAEDATGRHPEPAPPARVGVRFQRIGGDLRRALVVRQGGVLHDVLDTALYGARAHHSIASVRDIRPGFVYLRDALRELRSR